jgi:hypothetical protein
MMGKEVMTGSHCSQQREVMTEKDQEKMECAECATEDPEKRDSIFAAKGRISETIIETQI